MIIARAVAFLIALGPAPLPLAQPALAKTTASYAKAAKPVPFELFRGSRIFFEGTINGRPASMLLDSGADHTVIHTEFAKRIGLGEGKAQEVRGAGGKVQGRRVSGVTLAAGPFTARDAKVLVIDLGDITRQLGRPIDVILGMEAFSAGIVDIDFASRTLRFLPAAGFAPPPGAIAVPVTDREGRRTIPISVGGGPPIRADLDLGNGGTLLLAKSYWQKDSALAALPSAATTALGVGGRVNKRAVTLPLVTIAGQRFESVPAVLNEGANDLPITGANVGVGLLQRFRLIFHYAKSTLYMVPDAAQASAPFPKERVGMRVELAGDRLRVAEVFPNTAAADAGWKVGDEVIAVNGVPVSPGYYDREESRWGRMPAGTKLDLLRSDGKRMPVVLRDYF